MELGADESLGLRSRPVARACVPSALSLTRQKPSPDTSMSFLKYVGLVAGPLLDCGREADFRFLLSLLQPFASSSPPSSPHRPAASSSSSLTQLGPLRLPATAAAAAVPCSAASAPRPAAAAAASLADISPRTAGPAGASSPVPLPAVRQEHHHHRQLQDARHPAQVRRPERVGRNQP